ncbi:MULTISPECIES: cold shock domain-containing protein [unclassified Oceanobacter]|uniref:cold shock domain-containing protein n=1 Tax=unclassified Oceanobacter TaxID=2620260 RepID=UPI00273231D9|nr:MULTISPECIES: cold shock domain-containing protein [unclassified Oceanobacter]MDP2608726.1 cold shock domain-containing protein [Oceanobacter sp. 1_MG-2023]MDP2611822.1 cold shock domain-containing protein [Oceanobacter sp. 2_MG-2023]
MKTGTVKWFNNAKGYGFILTDEDNEELFAHYSTIVMDGYRTLKAGQAVQFDTKPSDKGTHAINIRTLDATASQAATTTPDTTPGTISESVTTAVCSNEMPVSA